MLPILFDILIVIKGAKFAYIFFFFKLISILV